MANRRPCNFCRLQTIIAQHPNDNITMRVKGSKHPGRGSAFITLYINNRERTSFYELTTKCICPPEMDPVFS